MNGQAQAPAAKDPLDQFNIKAHLDTPTSLADVLTTNRRAFLEYMNAKRAFNSSFRPLLQAIENGRVDEQAGASATAGGAASAAEKAGITDLVTAAMEAGAMTQTLDQNLLTLRGNAEGLFRFLSGQQVLPACLDDKDKNCDPSLLNNLELTASFDVSKSDTKQVDGQTLTGVQVSALLTSDKRQFSNATARYAIINSRNLRSSKYRAAWRDWYTKNSAGVAAVSGDLLKNLDSLFSTVDAKDTAGNPVAAGGTTAFEDWRSKARDMLAPLHTEAQIRAELAKQLDLLEAKMRQLDPSLDAKLDAVSNAYTRYFANVRGGFDLANMPMLTVEGTYSQPSLQPKLINAKVSFSWSPKTQGTLNPGTLTLNGGVSMYTKAQPSNTKGGTSVWRDAQFAFQFDRPVSGNAGNPVTFTLGGFVQYQMSPGLINVPTGTTGPGGVPLPPNAAQILAKQGTVAVAHASVTLQLPSSGVRVPIGISWSNRTELVTGNEIRGHIGFSFDTHSLLLH